MQDARAVVGELWAPQPDEYGPSFARYIDRVQPGRAVLVLEERLEALPRLLARVGEAGASHCYAAGKWSVREVVGHITDAERIFAYRALSFSRGDAANLPGFEEDSYVRESGAEDRSLASLEAEFRAVRLATLAFFRGLAAGVLTRRGLANGNIMSVRAAAAIIAGHELHHAGVLEERYLPGIPGSGVES